MGKDALIPDNPVKCTDSERSATDGQKSYRGTRVATKILHTTCEILNEAGFASLRVEDIADRAGVNKTTIYRRWPSKTELVIEAIKNSYHESQVLPNTGNLRQDMINYLRLVIKRTKNPIARGAMLTLHNCTDPALKPLAEELLNKARQARINIIQQGIDRGELPKNTDLNLASDLFSAPILRRLMSQGGKVPISYVVAVVDAAIAGIISYTNNKK